MKPPLTVTLDREKLNHPVHEKEEKSNKERRDKEMRKLRKNEGFTLAELLIVVAIIAVLVAVSIPIFTRQLEKSRESTDRANLRAAKAAVVSAILDGEISANGYYDAAKGLLTEKAPAVYGKGTKLKGSDTDADYKTDVDYTDAYISFSIDSTGVGTIKWSNGTDDKGTPITVGGKDMFSNS